MAVNVVACCLEGLAFLALSRKWGTFLRPRAAALPPSGRQSIAGSRCMWTYIAILRLEVQTQRTRIIFHLRSQALKSPISYKKQQAIIKSGCCVMGQVYQILTDFGTGDDSGYIVLANE